MRIRLFLNQIEGQTIFFKDKEFHYLNNVLRVKAGSLVYVFNQQYEYKSQVLIIEKKQIIAKIVEKINYTEILLNINACIPFIKPDTISRMVRQSVELGVKEINFFNSTNSSVRSLNEDKIMSSIIEALEQCGGIKIPKLNFYNNIENAIQKQTGKIIFGNEKTIYEKEHKNEHTEKFSEISVFIGPEGGFSEKEISFFIDYKAISLNLGHRILRADTALVSLITIGKNYIF